MPQIDMSDVVLDPAFTEPVTVLRQQNGGKFVEGEWVAGDPIRIEASATVVIPDAKDMDQIPEGDRIKGMATFYLTVPVYVSNPKAISDYIIWKGDTYRLDQVFDRSSYGFYKAVGYRIEGD